MKTLNELEIDAVGGGDSWAGTAAGQAPTSVTACMDSTFAATPSAGLDPVGTLANCIIRVYVTQL
jgi:hypothetical protein